MRRRLLAALLALAGTAQAALPRVEVDVPLTAPTYSGAPSAAVGGALSPFALSSPAPLLQLSALPATALTAQPLALPAAVAPAAPAALHAAALHDLPIPATMPGAAADGPVRRPASIDALRAHGAEAQEMSSRLGNMSAEDAAPALSRNFAAAANFDPELGGTAGAGGALTPGGGEHGARTPKLLPAPHHELLTRLLERVALDDGGDPAKRAALTQALSRMLQSETARGLAERFIAQGAKAVIRFEEFPGSRVYEADGRKFFHAARAFTEWREQDGTVVVRLNRDYLGTDETFLTRDLPPTIAHELLGHGLWYHSAVAQNVFQAFHHHELNETNARLVGWLVDYELDHRFEENGAWSFLQDPAGFLAYLKLRLPYYAMTFSNAELADPILAMETRIEQARAKRPIIELERANNRTWLPVIDHFIKDHGIPESKFRALRDHLESADKNYADDLEVNAALIAEVEANLGRVIAEPTRESERYLQWAATHPLFAALESETAAQTARLLQLVRENPPPRDHESERKAKEHWDGQITFDDLSRMVKEDRRTHPHHWR